MSKYRQIEETEEVKKEETKPETVKKVKEKKAKVNKEKRHRVKETLSELKKVTWPTFPVVVKKTGIVLAFVAISLVFLLAIDRLLSWIISLLQV